MAEHAGGGLVDFLVRMADDPALRERYERDARAVLHEQEGLTHEQREALLSGDLHRIRRVLLEAVPGSIAVIQTIKVPTIKIPIVWIWQSPESG